MFSKKYNLLFLFFIVVIIQKSDYLFSLYFGFEFGNLLGLNFFYLLPFVMVFDILINFNSNLKKIDYITIALFYYSLVLLIIGLLMYNSIDHILFEILTILIILYGYLYGLDKKLSTEIFKKKYYFIFILISVLCFIATYHTREHLIDYDLTDFERNTATLAYDLSPLLDFWPFLFLFNLFSKKYNRIFTWLPIIIYFSYQIYFLKRAPSVRVITFLLMASYISSGFKIINLKTILTIIVILILGVFFMPQNLSDRFIMSDTSRTDEAFQMLNSLTSANLFFGKGIGGSFITSSTGLSYIDQLKGFGKYVTHIGVAYVILKGGIILFLLIMLQLIQSIKYYFKYQIHANSIHTTCLTYLIVYTIFRLIEGPPTSGAIFDALLLGFSIGNLKSLAHENVNNRR